MGINEDRTIKALIPLTPSTVKTVDLALYDFINESLNLHTTTNKGRIKVPVVWAGQERSKQAKDNPEIRDLAQSLIFPIISIERETPNKSVESKGKYYANIPTHSSYGNSIVISSKIKQDKTANTANVDSRRVNEATGGGTGQINFPRRKNKVIYEVASIPQPVYYEVPYKISLKTEYQEQMNELIQPFMVRPGSVHRVMLTAEGWRYEAFIQPEYAQSNNLKDMSAEVRKFETEITIKVFGYVIGAAAGESSPFITVRETFSELKILRERVITGDINDFMADGKFRS